MLVDHKYTRKKKTYKTVYTSTLTYLDKYKELKLHLKLEPASRFKNAIMNWLFEHWTRPLDPRIQLTGSVFEKSIHCCD